MPDYFITLADWETLSKVTTSVRSRLPVVKEDDEFTPCTRTKKLILPVSNQPALEP